MLAGCIDPKGDYNQFVDRTDDIRGKVATDGGSGPEPDPVLPPIKGAAPASAIDTSYLVECLPSLAGGDPRKALRFVTTLSYAPGAAGGTLSMSLHPLLATATDLSERDPAGADITFASTAVGQDGRFSGPLGTVSIPGTSNPISGSLIVVERSALRGVFYDGDKMCTQLDGNAVQPVKLDIGGTPCLSKRFDGAQGALPKYAGSERAQFVCPL